MIRPRAGFVAFARAAALAGAAVMAAGAVAAGACSSQPRTFPFREVKAGKNSNFTIAQGRCFKSPDEYQRFASGIRALGPECDFPATLADVRWGSEMVVAIFGGPSETSQRVKFLRAGEFGGSLLVWWTRASGSAERVFQDDEVVMPKTPDDYTATTPFLLGTLPLYGGNVSFVRSQGLLEGP